jgi:hypothetical protein
VTCDTRQPACRNNATGRLIVNVVIVSSSVVPPSHSSIAMTRLVLLPPAARQRSLTATGAFFARVASWSL